MSQSCVQGGSNGFSVLSHGSQLVAEHGFYDVLSIIFDFPKAFYTRIYRFQKRLMEKYFVLSRNWQLEVNLTSNFSAEFEIVDVAANFAYHFRLLHGFLH